MPLPSSSTRIRSAPPLEVAMSMRVAPASSAFSTSSFTAAAGRSTTSPAAMRLTVPSESADRIPSVAARGISHLPPRAMPCIDCSRRYLPRQNLALFHAGLVERIDAHQPPHEDGLQHEMHHQRAHARIRPPCGRWIWRTGRPFLNKRLGRGAGFGSRPDRPASCPPDNPAPALWRGRAAPPGPCPWCRR